MADLQHSLSLEYEIIDLSDQTVLPGLIDLHVHLLHPDLGDYQMATLQQSSSFKALRALKNAQVRFAFAIVSS